MAHSTVLNEMESVSCSSFFTFNLYIYIINAQCRCASGWGAVSKAPIYDDEDYFLALRDFLEGGGPAAFSSEADAAGAEEEVASGVESFAAGFSTLSFAASCAVVADFSSGSSSSTASAAMESFALLAAALPRPLAAAARPAGLAGALDFEDLAAGFLAFAA